jgi:hypothetical protein
MKKKRDWLLYVVVTGLFVLWVLLSVLLNSPWTHY